MVWGQKIFDLGFCTYNSPQKELWCPCLTGYKAVSACSLPNVSPLGCLMTTLWGLYMSQEESLTSEKEHGFRNWPLSPLLPWLSPSIWLVLPWSVSQAPTFGMQVSLWWGTDGSWVLSVCGPSRVFRLCELCDHRGRSVSPFSFLISNRLQHSPV